MTKFFSLIHGDAVSKAPKAKILPAEEFSQLLNGAELLEQVKQDAEKYRLEVAKECEGLRAEAEKKGFGEGLEKWSKQIALLEEEIAKVRDEMKKVVVPLALKAAQKIVGREIELTPDTVADIVLTALKAVSQHRKITIYCNKHDLEILEKNKEKLKGAFEHLESLSIQERAELSPGSCVIETEAGIINALLENQWQALERALSAAKPTS